MIRNLIIFVFSAIAFDFFISKIVMVESENPLDATTFFLLPFVFGAITYLLMQGGIFERFGYIVFIPVFAVFRIPFYSETFGFHIAFFAPLMIAIGLGALAAGGIIKLVCSQLKQGVNEK